MKGEIMADNRQLAQAVLDAVGGADNIKNVAHCMTRLRFNLKDDSIPDDDQIKKIDGVIGVARAGAQYMVIIGQRVPQVYGEVISLTDLKASSAIDENLDGEKKPLTLKAIGGAILDYLSGSIVPCVPIIMVCGLFKTIQVIFGPALLGLLDETDDLYVLLNCIYNAGFCFLPIYVGYIAAQKLDVCPVLGMLLGGVLLEPNFLALVSAGETLTVFGISIPMVDYQSSIIPVLLSVWIMSYIYKFFQKHIPELFQTIATPFFTMLITIPLSLVVLAPIGSELGNLIGNAFYAAGSTGGVVSVIALVALCAVQQFLTITGMHMVLVTLGIAAYTQNGVETFALVANVLCNFSVWAMAFAAFLRLKNPNDKSAALGCFVSGVLGGVSEPSLYGIGMKYNRTFIGMVLGCAATGLVASLSGAICYQLGTSSVLCLLMFIDPAGGMNFVWALIAGLTGFVVSTVWNYLFGFTPEEIEGKAGLES